MLARRLVLATSAALALLLASSTSCSTRSSNDEVAACTAQDGVWVEGSGCTAGHSPPEVDHAP